MKILRVLALFGLAFATGALTGPVGCGAVDAAFDCQQVCTKYHDCFDGNYDIGKCRDRCRTSSANDSTVRAKADACESCIEGKSCVGSFPCALDCGTIVPGDQ
ncbi:MAG: hypothetical protein JWM82_1537 [Myxococcales bacterium]|nr:hypothetical protein [Myxococcales bacterium]